MYKKHQTSKKGDRSFMEDLLSENLRVQHMDSYNTKEGKRFQGSFYYVFDGREVFCNEAPLEILKIAKRYQVRTCGCLGNEAHITWTIWFD